MKILFINSLSADYVQDLTYSGLVKKFGVSNVVDYPWNKKYHVHYKRYPKDLGYTPFSFVPSLLNRLPLTYDLVIVGSAKVDCFEAYNKIAPSINDNTPVIFIDGGDRNKIGLDLSSYQRPELYEEAINRRPFDFIFKREYLLSDQYDENVFSLPISFNLDRLPTLPQAKTYGVSFWAVESAPIRTEALKLLTDQFDCQTNGTENNQKFSKYARKGTFYLEELARCNIVLNFRGGGWDTLRYWEVPAIGSFMITQKPQIHIPHDFVHGEHVIHCKDDLSDLLDLCQYYLDHPAEREEIAQAGAKHMRDYHTDEKRADYILEKIGQA